MVRDEQRDAARLRDALLADDRLPPNVLRQSDETMRDLLRDHADQLDEECFHALREMADLTEELIDHPVRTVGLASIVKATEQQKYKRTRKGDWGLVTCRIERVTRTAGLTEE